MKRTKNEWNDATPFLPNLQVFEEATAPVETGLLDATGAKLFKQPERIKIGFDLSRKGVR